MSIFKDEEVVNKQFFEEFGTDLTFQISYGLIVNQIMCSKYDSILSDCINQLQKEYEELKIYLSRLEVQLKNSRDLQKNLPLELKRA